MNDLDTLKSGLNFKTAFKATMGFYVAQFVATLLGLVVFALTGAVILGGLYWLVKR